MRRDRLARGKFIRFVRLVILVFFISALVFFIFRKQEGGLISPITSMLVNSNIPILNTDVDNTQLRLTVQDVLIDASGEYAIVISNLKSGESYSFNEHKVFDSASLYKLWVMGAVYEQIQSGVWREYTLLSESVEVLNRGFNIASESAELSEGTISMPVKTALERMITISDNYSAHLLSWKLKSSKIIEYMKAKGFAKSTLGSLDALPTTTAYDIALFFEKLNKGQLASTEYSQKMISLLKAQQLNNKLPKLLPKEIVIAHKTGELGLTTHDAGIVYSAKGDYIIVVLSKSSRPKDAEVVISQISKAVFDYFEK